MQDLNQKLITLIKELQALKAPVMAIGSQTHVNASSPSFEEEDREGFANIKNKLAYERLEPNGS